jgi:two-component system OmpR family response regulator
MRGEDPRTAARNSDMKIGVYLVEDSAIMSTLLQELVETNDAWIVGHAETARTAIADIGRVSPDVIIIDIALRQGNGFDVLKWLRDNPQAKRPLYIVLTNYTLTSYRNAAKRLGADYFFDKSTDIPQLLRVLRSLARKRGRANGTG